MDKTIVIALDRGLHVREVEASAPVQEETKMSSGTEFGQANVHIVP